MMKSWLFILFSGLFAFQSQAQHEQYGPFIGGNMFLYKSNLYNSHDLQADSVQGYAFTPGFAGGFDFGYRYENGISIHSGLWFGTSNQKYKGKDSIIGDVVTFEAKTTMSYLKVPLMITMQTRNYEPLKAFYSVGLYYSLNTGFSETATWDYQYEKIYKDRTMTIDNKRIENKLKGDSNTYVSTLDQRPYRRHGLGAVMAMGFSKRLNKNTEWYMLAKLEYQLTNSENNNEVLFNPEPGSKDARRLGYVWGNYAKYMHATNSNYNRPATHPFNFGINIGLRYFVFDFE